MARIGTRQQTALKRRKEELDASVKGAEEIGKKEAIDPLSDADEDVAVATILNLGSRKTKIGAGARLRHIGQGNGGQSINHEQEQEHEDNEGPSLKPTNLPSPTSHILPKKRKDIYKIPKGEEMPPTKRPRRNGPKIKSPRISTYQTVEVVINSSPIEQNTVSSKISKHRIPENPNNTIDDDKVAEEISVNLSHTKLRKRTAGKARFKASKFSMEGTIPTENKPYSPGTTEGLSSILLDPSPVKLSRKDVGLEPFENLTDKTPHANSGNTKFNVDTENLSDDSEQEPEDKSASPAEEEGQPEPEAARGNKEMHTMYVDFKLLTNLIERVDQICRSFKQESGDLTMIRQIQKAESKLGSKMQGRLDNLIARYKKWQSPGLEVDRKAQANISDLIQSQKDQTHEITTQKLAKSKKTGTKDNSITNLLIDIYFVLVPKLLKCVKLGAKAYHKNNLMSLIGIQEVRTLLDSFCHLTGSATSQPTDVQPRCLNTIKKTHSRATSRTSQPIKEVLKDVLKLREQFKARLSSITQAEIAFAEAEREQEEAEKAYREEEENTIEKKARARQEAQERARQDEENYRLIQQERDRAIKERHRWQRRVLERKQEELRLGDSKEMLKLKSEHRAQKARSISDQRVVDESDKVQARSFDEEPQSQEDESDPFADEQVEPVERVSVFPNNNKHKNAPTPWSDKQKIAFIHCMMKQGEDKYERAAERLQCSMEEIFSAAKDLQEAHDKAHEDGHLNGVDDEWTYNIWVGN